MSSYREGNTDLNFADGVERSPSKKASADVSGAGGVETGGITVAVAAGADIVVLGGRIMLCNWRNLDHTTLDDISHLKKSSDDATLDDTSYSKKSSDHATLDETSYSKNPFDHATLNDTSSSSEVLPPNILRMLLPPQKVVPSTERKVKKDSYWSSTSHDSDGCCLADSSDGPLCKQEPVHSSYGPLCKQEHVDYSERPGRPECPFLMRFGDCKFASACKYHHSKDKYPTRYHPEVPSLGGEQTEYPEIPGEPDCPFYMKNRFCKFGAQCRFNHPKDLTHTMQSPTNVKKSVATDEHHQSTRIAVEDNVPQQEQYPERPGQPNCRYYLQFGKCKFMSACIFHHPRDGLPVAWKPSECPFYMKTGKCQFGSACEFHHPKDICSTRGMSLSLTDLACDNFTRRENAVQTQEQIMYPEKPGEPRCFNYMRHGSCRFQMNCKYHHPADWLSRKQYD
ncbi:zinc finger CCCH domain-containing protein 8-like [Triticum aestivum]|uniref:zinc finger CCCH domain-containing protein 8-like n=1 Tax=Triticum aestivum TaxID=4565 RepID=UPI001D0307AE|nr:zinc finger CCCH domain-containing protein 8-like [Triticum aestivum]